MGLCKRDKRKMPSETNLTSGFAGKASSDANEHGPRPRQI